MTEDVLDIDSMISRLAKAEKSSGEGNIKMPFHELIKVLERLQDKNLPEEYNEAVSNMANQICALLEGNLIAPKRSEVINAIKKKFSYDSYKKILKSAINELSKSQKGWKATRKKP